MSWTQVTTTPRYTKREKQAYRARARRRGLTPSDLEYIFGLPTGVLRRKHHFADNYGSCVPTPRPRSEYL